MDYLIDNFSALTICIILIAASVLFSCLILYVLRRFFDKIPFKKNHDVSAIVFGSTSMLYSLILAFVMVAVWEDYENMNKYILDEATKLEKIKLEAEYLPVKVQKQVIQGIDDYIDAEVNKKEKSNFILHNLRKVLRESNDGISNNAADEIDKELIDTIQLNNNRASGAHSHIPSFIWMILIFGSLATITLTCFFKSELEYVYICLTASMITTCLTVIYILDHPLSNAAQLDYAPFLLLRG